jgi:hypothetical protein
VQGVLDAVAPNAPLRNSMISGPDALQRFIDAGYDPEDSREW